MTQPRVLLLDEPLTGLDAELKAAIVDDLRAWNAARRIPILYVTHTREEVDALGERVIAMDHGRVISTGTPMEVLEAPRHKRLAQAAGFENLLRGTVVDLREADGVMRVRLNESRCEIEVPLGYAAAGDRVHVAIRAGDILLATSQPHDLSARNVIEGKIASYGNARNARPSSCRLWRGIYRAPHAGSREVARSSGRTPRLAGAENSLLPSRRGIIEDEQRAHIQRVFQDFGLLAAAAVGAENLTSAASSVSPFGVA